MRVATFYELTGILDGDGPLYYDEGADKWYCNGEFTGEFMVDSDLSLLNCKGVGFERHHNNYCRKDHARCNDRGQRDVDAGAKLLARLIAQKTLSDNKPLRDLFLDEEIFSINVGSAWDEILRSFSKVKTTGDMKHTDPAARPIVLAMLDRFAARRSRKELGALFHSNEELELTLRHGAAVAFGIPLEKVAGAEDR